MYLLDTNALRKLMVMELRHGSSQRPDRDAFWHRIEREILVRVSLLDIGLREALLAGDVLAHLSRRGELIGLEHLLIGVTALARGYIVITANLRHFQRIPNLRAENWLA